MGNLETIQIKNAFDFTNSLVIEGHEELRNLFLFMNGFNEIYIKEKECLPYHINLIDELHADENAHSRIFAKLLRFKVNDKFPFIEKFLNVVCGFKLTTKKPNIKKVDSCGRIDIPIFDDNYVVVIENKVTDKAPDQNNQNGGQLARYIETIEKNYGRNLKDIYVIYTPKYSREPSDDCWINKENFSYKNDFNQRFCSLSYRDVIYPWLKNDILPLIDKKDVYLCSALEQYVDYLEGMFSIRTIDKEMNMKLQEFIKNELGIEDDKPEEAIKSLSEKETELNNAINQIQLLKNSYQKQILIREFDDWREQIPNKYKNSIRYNYNDTDKYFYLSVIFEFNGKDFACGIGKDELVDNKIYSGISVRGTKKEEKYDSISILSKELFPNEEESPRWYVLKQTKVENAYRDFIEFINIIEKRIENPNR